jgi:hypothetical protein
MPISIAFEATKVTSLFILYKEGRNVAHIIYLIDFLQINFNKKKLNYDKTFSNPDGG